MSDEERDNFFCLTCLLLNIGSKTLRSYFKNTWPKVNGTKAAWSDVPADGVLLLGITKGLRLANHEKAAVQAGDTNEWDLTIVIKVLMHSKFTHGPGFVIPCSQKYKWLDDIREIRNQLIGHAKETKLPNADFLRAWKVVMENLVKFGAAKEEITAVRNDIEHTRKDAEKYLQRLLDAEEREEMLVEHLETVDKKLGKIQEEVSLNKNKLKDHKEADVATNSGYPHGIQIHVKAEAGAHVAIGDITAAGKPRGDSVNDDDNFEEPDIPNGEDDDSDDDYESGAEYGPITQCSHDTYCATRYVRSKRKYLGYDELLPSYKKTSMSGEWKPEPLSEVITSKFEGISEEEWSAEKLFRDPDEYLQRMASSGGDTKSKVEQKFLQEILPSLESECRKSGHHSDEIYQILAKLGCCQTSQSIVKHSLYLLRHLLTKDKVELTNARTIVKVENILRGSFSSKDGLFNLESFAAQRLRLTVYSKVLCLLAICRCKGFVTFQSINSEEREHAKVLLENLQKCFSDKSYRKKDRLRHVAELTLTSLKWIFTEKQPIDQPSIALQCFKELLSKFDSFSEQEVSQLVKTLCGCGGFSLQVTLCCIEHEIRSNANALKLLLSIVENETNKKMGTHDWKFFTAVSGILSNATMTNRDKDIRTIAGRKLQEFLGDDKVKKTPKVMEAIQRKLNRVLFSPDPPVRILLARVLSEDPNESISKEHMMNYLCWFYRNQALEREVVIKETKNELVYLGSFQGRTVAIKTMRPCFCDLGSHGSEVMESVKSSFTKEAYFLRRLNEVAKHPNIIHLLCCNTVRIPYHLITEYMNRGNLLKYLRQDCRSETPLRVLANLSQWCLDILEALVFLSKYKIVHKKIMARSVFVAEDEVCKLSGFSAAEQGVEEESGVIMCSSGKVQLDNPGVVRWLAPEVLIKECYSKASDVWAFGVLMHEVFSLGCDPFRPGPGGRPIDDDLQVVELIRTGNHLPKLPCFDKKVYKLMERCWMESPSDRIPVEQLRGDLLKLQQEFMKTGARLPASPPPVFPEVQSSNEEDALWRAKEPRMFPQKKKASSDDVGRIHITPDGTIQCNQGEAVQAVRKKARVMYDRQAEDEDELTLEVGDVVDVLDEISDGWWLCEIGDKRGLFPSNYVEILEMGEMAQAKDKLLERQGKPQCDSLNDHVYENIDYVYENIDDCFGRINETPGGTIQCGHGETVQACHIATATETVRKRYSTKDENEDIDEDSSPSSSCPTPDQESGETIDEDPYVPLEENKRRSFYMNLCKDTSLVPSDSVDSPCDVDTLLPPPQAFI